MEGPRAAVLLAPTRIGLQTYLALAKLLRSTRPPRAPCFSGWGGSLSERERWLHEKNRVFRYYPLKSQADGQARKAVVESVMEVLTWQVREIHR